jgi:hypothetical protein
MAQGVRWRLHLLLADNSGVVDKGMEIRYNGSQMVRE